MKFPIISTAIVTLCALAGAAQAELKVASVSVKELYTMFYKRFETETTLQKHLEEIKAQVKEREDKLRLLQEDVKKIRDKYDSSLSEAAVAKLREQNNAKILEVRSAEQELKDFVQRRSVIFRELRNREMSTLIEEVQAAINEVASKQGVDIVLDSGAIAAQPEIGIGTPVFPFMKKSFDITPEVLKQLNAKAPAGFDPKAELKSLYGDAAENLPGVAPAQQ